MLLRFDPFHDLNRLTSEILGSARVPQSMPMDCYRLGDTFYLHFDLPGIDAETLEVTQENNTLTVHALRSTTPPPDAVYLIAERPVGSYARQLVVGDGLSLEEMAADYHDGVLTLTIPVAETVKPRRVNVTRTRRNGVEGGIRQTLAPEASPDDRLVGSTT